MINAYFHNEQEDDEGLAVLPVSLSFSASFSLDELKWEREEERKERVRQRREGWISIYFRTRNWRLDFCGSCEGGFEGFRVESSFISLGWFFFSFGEGVSCWFGRLVSIVSLED